MLEIDTTQRPLFLRATALALTPGSGLVHAVARPREDGLREGLAPAPGAAARSAVREAAAALGLSLLVSRSAVAFGLVHCAGA